MRGKGEVIGGGKHGVSSSETRGKKGDRVTGGDFARGRVEGRISTGGE